MITVGVIRGGRGPDYDLSLKTGGEILNALRGSLRDKYLAVDIFLDKDGNLHMNGLPANWEDLTDAVQIVFNALLGSEGENSEVQKIFEDLGILYTGTKRDPLEETLSKIIAKEIARSKGINVPSHIMIPQYVEVFDNSVEEWSARKAREIHQKMPPPWLVRSVRGGKGDGIVVNTLPELILALGEFSEASDDLLIEEIISGEKAVVGVLENFRDKNHYAFFPLRTGKIEIMNKGLVTQNMSGARFGYFKEAERKILENFASAIHDAFKLSHYSNSHFVVHPKKGIYYLGTTVSPALHDGTPMNQMINSVGSSVPEFVDHVLELALNK